MWGVDRRAVRGAAGRRGRSALDPGLDDLGPFRRRRIDRRPAGRTAAVRPHHGPVAAFGGHCGDILELAVGTDRLDRIDPADSLSVGRRAAHQGAQPARCPAGRHAGADHARALLSARAVGRFGRNHRRRAGLSEAQFLRELLRSRVDARPAPGAHRSGGGHHQRRSAGQGAQRHGRRDRGHRRGKPQARAPVSPILGPR